MILNSNCSEAVFRFYTLDPEKMHKILSWIAEEVRADGIDVPEIPEFEDPKQYESVVIPAVNYDGVVTVEEDKGAFRLNIGNNSISPNTTGWIEKIIQLGIEVEEAEFSEELSKLARDCTCGIRYFTDYEHLKRDPPSNKESDKDLLESEVGK